MIFWHLLPTSHRILLLLGLTYFVNVALRGMLTQYLALTPVLSIGGGQYWRFISYPFAVTGFWEILATSATLYFFAPEVERIFGSRRLLLVLGIFIVVHALVFAPLLVFSQATLAGTTSPALFILALYIYLYPSGEISLFGILPLRATMFLCILFAVALASSVMNFSLNPAAVAHTFADEGFGIFFGFLFAHLYFGRSSGISSAFGISNKKQPVSTRRTAAPSPASVGRIAGRAQEVEHHPARRDIDDEEISPLDEDRLNEILDKINEQGQASLTAQERQFLQDYATRL